MGFGFWQIYGRETCPDYERPDDEWFRAEEEVLDEVSAGGLEQDSAAFVDRFPLERLLSHGLQVAIRDRFCHLAWSTVIKCIILLLHYQTFSQVTECFFREYFRHLRELFRVDPADYMMAICGNDALRELSSPGKSGSFFYLTQDDRFMIKTVKKSEVKVCCLILLTFISLIFKVLVTRTPLMWQK